MECETILSLILLGGVALGVTTGTVTEIALTKAGLYKPKNYLAEWRKRWKARSEKSASVPA